MHAATHVARTSRQALAMTAMERTTRSRRVGLCSDRASAPRQERGSRVSTSVRYGGRACRRLRPCFVCFNHIEQFPRRYSRHSIFEHHIASKKQKKRKKKKKIQDAQTRVGSWKLTSRVTSMQNLDVISHPCRNGWTLQYFHIWSHIHAESGSDGCHICKIHVKFSARAARALAMHVRNHMQNHI